MGRLHPSPTDLAATTAPLFFTRWITHICAPVFVFLAGTSAYLYGSKRSPTELAQLLFTRGLWLVLIELTVCKYVWIPEPGYSLVLIQVIWVIGWSMIALAGLCFLGRTIVIAIGIIIVCGHNFLDPLVPSDFGIGAGLWNLLHEGGNVTPTDGVKWMVSYPILPWIGVIALGYGFGTTIELNIATRRRLYMRLGLAMTAAFVLIRATNFYGDPNEWTMQANGTLTLLSFLNTTKYPPSLLFLLFLLMTLGPALCLLSLFSGWAPGRLRNALLVFGRVPLFLLRAASVPTPIHSYPRLLLALWC